MNKNLILTGLAAIIGISSLSSQIIPFVDDFEESAEADWAAIKRDNNVISAGALPIVNIGGSDTLGLWGIPTAGNSEARAILDAGSAVDAGSGFLKIEVDFYYTPTATGDGFVGTSQAGGASATTNAFGTFNAYAGINPETNTLFARNEAVTGNVNINTSLTAETWYTLTLYVSTANQNYDVYLNGTIAANDFSFRSVSPVQELFLMTQMKVGGVDQVQGVYFDNYSASLVSVPEQSTIALIMGLAGLGLVLYRRRK